MMYCENYIPERPPTFCGLTALSTQLVVSYQGGRVGRCASLKEALVFNKDENMTHDETAVQASGALVLDK